jgi:hypothetical protein
LKEECEAAIRSIAGIPKESKQNFYLNTCCDGKIPLLLGMV